MYRWRSRMKSADLTGATVSGLLPIILLITEMGGGGHFFRHAADTSGRNLYISCDEHWIYSSCDNLAFRNKAAVWMALYKDSEAREEKETRYRSTQEYIYILVRLYMITRLCNASSHYAKDQMNKWSNNQSQSIMIGLITIIHYLSNDHGDEKPHWLILRRIVGNWIKSEIGVSFRKSDKDLRSKSSKSELNRKGSRRGVSDAFKRNPSDRWHSPTINVKGPSRLWRCYRHVDRIW